MISSRLGHFLDKPLAPLARRLKLSPDQISLTGFAVTALGAVLIPFHPRWASLVVLVGGFFDMLDGVAARTQRKSSPFGAFLDSVLDRYSDGLLFVGIAVLFVRMDNVVGALLSLGSLVGAYVISYARARAEGLGLDCQTGLMERGERVVLLVFGLLTGWLLPVLWVLFLLSHLTAVQRVLHVRRRRRSLQAETRTEERAPGRPEPAVEREERMKRIVVFGDVHMAIPAIQKIPNLEEADLVIVNGDLTNFGGREDAEKVINALLLRNRKVLALHGNLDHPDVEQLLVERGVSLHSKGRLFGDVGIFGVGGSNITPFRTPTEYSEKDLAGFLATAHESIEEARHFIMVCHTPPSDSKVDRIRTGLHVGSRAVREFIEKVQPEICITGHIHEARGADRIGRTDVYNPGMLQDGMWVEISLTDDTVQARLEAWS